MRAGVINKTKALLANTGFVSKAPQKLIDNEKDKLEKALEKLEKLEKAHRISRLQNLANVDVSTSTGAVKATFYNLNVLSELPIR